MVHEHMGGGDQKLIHILKLDQRGLGNGLVSQPLSKKLTKPIQDQKNKEADKSKV